MISPDQSVGAPGADQPPIGVMLDQEPTPLYIQDGIRLLPFPSKAVILEDRSTEQPVATFETASETDLRITHELIVRDGIYVLLKEIERPEGGLYFAETADWPDAIQLVLKQIMPIVPGDAIAARDAGAVTYAYRGIDVLDIGGNPPSGAEVPSTPVIPEPIEAAGGSNDVSPAVPAEEAASDAQPAESEVAAADEGPVESDQTEEDPL